MNKRDPSHEMHHDDADKFPLGGVMCRYGLRRGDARALDALMRESFLAFVLRTPRDNSLVNLPVGELIRWMIDEAPRELDDIGSALELERRREAYYNAREHWLASGHNRPDAKWRGRPVTRNQRYLIASVCRQLEIGLPELLSRGAAADWLEEQSAHPVLRSDDE